MPAYTVTLMPQFERLENAAKKVHTFYRQALETAVGES